MALALHIERRRRASRERRTTAPRSSLRPRRASLTVLFLPKPDGTRMLRTLPWIVDDATTYLQTYIDTINQTTQPSKVLEFGTGASTLWLGHRVSYLVSIDHDRNWHDLIDTMLTSSGCTSAHLRLCERPYFRLSDEYNDGQFDVVFVDGRDRVKCVEQSRRVLKPAGILLLDNAERIGDSTNQGPYFEILNLTRGWPCIHFEQRGADRTGWLAPHRWITSIFHKPNGDELAFHTTAGKPL